MSTDGGFDGFDSWLDQHLQDALQAHTGPSPLAAQSAYHAATAAGGMGSVSLLSTITSALTTKAAAGVAVAALVAGGSTAVIASTASGSTDPGVWGKTVTQAVADCKASAARLDQHGIGRCVSAIASQHGQQERDLHASQGRTNASNARREHQPATPGRKDDAGKPSARPTDAGRPSEHPGGPPSSVPAGPPAGVPGGPPSGAGGSHR